MLVEDDAATRMALRTILARLDLEVITAFSLAGAILSIADRIDYLILDLMLPDGEGIVLLRAIRDAKFTIRVAITTGSIERARIEAIRLLRPDVFLFTPIVLEELVRGLGLGDEVGSSGPIPVPGNRHSGS